MKSKKLQFTGSSGDALSARIDLPDQPKPDAFALFAHCFTCSKNLNAIGHIAKALTDRNWAVFRFDFTGLGESKGDFADTNFSSNIDDLVKAAKYMKAEFEAPDLLVGHSLGGAAVLLAAHKIFSCKALATIGAPCNPVHVKQNFATQIDEINKKGHAQVTLGGRTFNIKKQFIDDLEETHVDQRIEELNRALLLFHSPTDNTVGIENASHIFGHAKHPKSFISLDGADHLLSREKDSKYVGNMLATWADRYI